MRRELLMPKLGLTMTEGLLSEWMVKVGGSFKVGDGLFVVETDKVATEIPADGDGVLTEIVVPMGETVAVGEIIGYWDDGAGAGATAAPTQEPSPAPLITVPKAARLPAPAIDTALSALQANASAMPAASVARIPVTPLARRLAKQLQVDLACVAGSGPRGRIQARDVQAATTAKSVPIVECPPHSLGAVDLGTRTKPSSVHAAMARRLTAVKQEVPHFYLAVEAEVSRLLALRRELNALGGPLRLTLNHFVMAAIGRALHDLPEANRVWSDGEIVTFASADVGVAVNTERGLFVPVVRDVGRLPLSEVARLTQAQVDKARAGMLTTDDMAGGAVTVSNAGMFNVTYLTPIINPGQAMILGVGSVRELFRPDAEGRPALRQELGLVLAADHRILDGVSGLRFLNSVVAYLEQPMKLLLGA